MRGQRIAFQIARLQQFVDCQTQGNPAPGDGGATRAAIGLNDIAIDGDLPLTQGDAVDPGAQGPAYQALDFLSAARLLACLCLTSVAGGGGAGQHAIFRRDPAQTGIAQPWWHPFFQRSGAQHMRVATTDDARPLGVHGHVRLDGNGAQLIDGPAGWAHDTLL